ncbi:MAG: hypothetical protein U0R76_08905 [Candidatus Nanopelagicales bacterium]
MRMPNVMFRLSGTPGRIRHAGGCTAPMTDEVLRETGLTDEQIAASSSRGIV